MNTHESVESDIEHTGLVLSEQDKLRIINEMQVRVASELLGPHSEDENQIMFKWVASSKGTSLSKKFREIINEHPELIEQYADVNELHAYNQDSVIAKIEEFLHEDPVSADILAKMPAKISETSEI